MSALEQFKAGLVKSLREALASGKDAPIPDGSSLIWKWFMDLNSTRSWHANGPNPISHFEMQAYSIGMCWQFKQHHIELIRAMDDAYIAHFNERLSTDKGKPQPSGDLTTAAFDAVFG